MHRTLGERRGREFAEALRSQAEQRVIHRVPLPKAAGAIGIELVAEQVIAAHIHDALAQLPVKDCDDFRLADEQATHAGMALGEGDDVRAVRLGELELGDVAGIEVDHRPSRISEMI